MSCHGRSSLEHTWTGDLFVNGEQQKGGEPQRLSSVVHLESSVDVDQAQARQILQDWHEQAVTLDRAHLAASISYGRRAKQCGLFSVVLMMLGLTVSSLAPSLVSTATGSSQFAVFWVEELVPWMLASAGLVLFFVTEGLEYPKRAALHNHAYKEFSSIQKEIDVLLVKNVISFREMHQISIMMQKATERMQSVRLSI